MSYLHTIFTDNWMPVRGLGPVAHNKNVFATESMNEGFEIAQVALREWRRRPRLERRLVSDSLDHVNWWTDRFHSASLIQQTNQYLNRASEIKRCSTSQTFNLGIPWVYVLISGHIYYSLIVINFALAFTVAITEIYPANINKPLSVEWIDVAGAIVTLGLSILVALFGSTKQYAYVVAGISRFFHKVGKGYFVARNCCCPKAPVLSHQDKFNIFGPAVAKAIVSDMTIMLNFSSPLPLTGPGELFHSSFGIGSQHGWGLSQYEKYVLLNVLFMGNILHQIRWRNRIGTDEWWQIPAYRIQNLFRVEDMQPTPTTKWWKRWTKRKFVWNANRNSGNHD